MQDEFQNLNDEEKLKAENEFLKMKLMLEKGAQFGKMETDSELSPDMENEFLNYIMEFEKQSENPTYIKVFDKIERPTNFKPSALIPDELIEQAWQNLSDYLNQYQINLDVCSPNISSRELYRFTVEELFEHEMSDMHVPGMMHCFIYDEFYPDHIYDNTRKVQDDLFPDIFSKKPMSFDYGFKDDLSFNHKVYKDFDALKDAVNNFKTFFEEINLEKCIVSSCSVEEASSTVKGIYEASAIAGKEKMIFQGEFIIGLLLNSVGFHSIKDIFIEGIHID
jgi:hypothetical protein